MFALGSRMAVEWILLQDVLQISSCLCERQAFLAEELPELVPFQLREWRGDQQLEDTLRDAEQGNIRLVGPELHADRSLYLGTDPLIGVPHGRRHQSDGQMS